MRFYATPHRMGIYGYHGINSFSALNRYGHPGSETMERFDERGIPTVVTSERGQIIIEKTDDGFKVRTMLIQ